MVHQLTFLCGNCPYLPSAPWCPDSRHQKRPRDPGPANESPAFQGTERLAQGLARFRAGRFRGGERQCWELGRDHLNGRFVFWLEDPGAPGGRGDRGQCPHRWQQPEGSRDPRALRSGHTRTEAMPPTLFTRRNPKSSLSCLNRGAFGRSPASPGAVTHAARRWSFLLLALASQVLEIHPLLHVLDTHCRGQPVAPRKRVQGARGPVGRSSGTWERCRARRRHPGQLCRGSDERVRPCVFVCPRTGLPSLPELSLSLGTHELRDRPGWAEPSRAVLCPMQLTCRSHHRG